MPGQPPWVPLIALLRERRDHEGRLAATVDALVASTAEVEPALIALADSGPPPPVACDAVQVTCLRAGARCRAAVPLFARLAEQADDNVAVAALDALGNVGGADTLEPLLRAVERREFFRAFPPIDALGRSGDARALPPLVPLLAEPRSAPAAARALGHTGQERAVAPLAGAPRLCRGRRHVAGHGDGARRPARAP